MASKLTLIILFLINNRNFLAKKLLILLILLDKIDKIVYNMTKI